MSGTNDDEPSAAETAANGDERRGKDTATGKFQVGNTYGEGRPKGASRVDLIAVCRRKAENEGASLDHMLWTMVKGLILAAAKGDSSAGKLVLERLCVPVEQAPLVSIDMRGLQAAPLPTDDELLALVDELKQGRDEVLADDLPGARS